MLSYNVKINKKNVTTSGWTQTRLTGVRTPGARGGDVAQNARGGARRDASEHVRTTKLRRLVKFV